MIPVWPAVLPQSPLRSGWRGGPRSARVSFAPDYGPPIERRAITAETAVYDATFGHMRRDQIAAFRAFHDVDLAGGISGFAWRDPITGDPGEWRMLAPDMEWSEAAMGATLSTMSVQMMRVPGPQWWNRWAPREGALVLPAMVCDFRRGVAAVDGSRVAFGDLVTVSGGANGQVLNASGAWVAATAGAARVSRDPANLSTAAGALVEAARTNLLLNSATLATQSVTVTAVQHVLSFTGTGSVTLSGAATGTLAGTGAGEAARVSLAFTPTEGSLTLTVSGTVTTAQLEAGPAATSWIATTGAAVTRSADSIVFANLSWLAATGTLVAIGRRRTQPLGVALFLSDGTTSNREQIGIDATGRVQGFVATGGTGQVNISSGAAYNDQRVAFAMAIAANDAAVAAGGAMIGTDSAVTLPALNFARIGGITTSNSVWNGIIEAVAWYPQRLSNAQIVQLTGAL